MKPFTHFYLNKASYKALDETGETIDIEINYWENTFKISQPNPELENFAKKLLAKKHKVNFVHKMSEQ